MNETKEKKDISNADKNCLFLSLFACVFWQHTKQTFNPRLAKFGTGYFVC